MRHRATICGALGVVGYAVTIIVMQTTHAALIVWPLFAASTLLYAVWLWETRR